MGLLTQLLVKAAVSGVIVALAAEAARRSPGWGGLIASLPLVSLLAMVWLWQESGDAARVADFAVATTIYVLGSLPALLVVAFLLRQGQGFWLALAGGSAAALACYALLGLVGPRLGLPI